MVMRAWIRKVGEVENEGSGGEHPYAHAQHTSTQTLYPRRAWLRLTGMPPWVQLVRTSTWICPARSALTLTQTLQPRTFIPQLTRSLSHSQIPSTLAPLTPKKYPVEGRQGQHGGAHARVLRTRLRPAALQRHLQARGQPAILRARHALPGHSHHISPGHRAQDLEPHLICLSSPPPLR